MTESILRIGHASDLHLRQRVPGVPSLPVRRGRELFQWLPALFKSFAKEGVDLLLLTGDILDVPRWLVKDGWYYDYDFTFWEQMVYLDYLSVASLLRQAPFPVGILPGNHDHPGLFRKVFGRQLEPISVNGYSVYLFADWPHRGSAGRRVDEERKLFDRSFRDDRPQIHAQHYVIAPQIDSHYPYNYAESPDLYRKILQSGRVRLSLSGHYHAGADTAVQIPGTRDGMRFFTARSISEAPYPYYIHTLGPDSIETKVKYLREEPLREKAVFLDRDGCLTEAPSYSSGPGDIRIMPGVVPALKKMKAKGYRLVVVSDQSAVGRGYVHRETVQWVNDELSRQLAEKGVEVDGYYFSTGAGSLGVLPWLQNNRHRKPSPALLQQAAEELNLSLRDSVMVGDRISDCLAGLQAGVRSFLVRTGYGREEEQNIQKSRSIQVVDSLEGLLGYLYD